MDVDAKQELELIKKELQKIINELNSISSGVSKDFKGIGNDRCASSISKAASQYKTVKNKLDNMNLSVVTDEFAKRHPV